MNAPYRIIPAHCPELARCARNRRTMALQARLRRRTIRDRALVAAINIIGFALGGLAIALAIIAAI